MSLGYVSIASLLLLNAVASIVVLRSRLFTGSQRARQLALIWLVPAIGAVMCTVFVFSQPKGHAAHSGFDPLNNPSDGGGPEVPDFGICGCSGGAPGDAGGGASD
ncbi:MAG: hypothetical protein KDA57_20950 [Planctomycetales bacterium]|nr:hypothetical protein [Planctomycetales bacterium]